MHRKSRPGRSKMDNHQLDDQFDAFLRESISSEDSSFDTSRIAKFLDSQKKKDEPPWWSAEDSTDDAGLLGTGKQFMKSKKLDNISESVAEQKQVEGTKATEVYMSKDSLEDESSIVRTGNQLRRQGPRTFVVPALNLGSSPSCTESTNAEVRSRNGRLGAETMAELQDKESFFKELEKSTDQTIDYAQLNQELDGSGTIHGTLNSTGSKALIQEYSPESHNGDIASDQYEDVESDHDDRIVSDHNERDGEIQAQQLEDTPDSGRPSAKPRQGVSSNMLANVALLDSLDSTFGTRAGGSRDALKEDEEMSAIPENVTARPVNHRARDSEEDCHPEDFSEDDEVENDNEGGLEGGMEKDEGSKFTTGEADDRNGVDSGVVNRVTTLKTATVVNTDTSREIEALHQALRQIGMATLDTMKDFSLKEDSSRLLQESEQLESTSKTAAGFGLRQMVPSMADTNERTIGDIAEEVEALKKISHTKDDISILGMDTTMFLQKISEQAGLNDNKKQIKTHANSMANGHASNINEVIPGSEIISEADSTRHRVDEAQNKAKHTKDNRFSQVKSSGYGQTSPVRKTENKKPPSVTRSPGGNKSQQKAVEKPRPRSNTQSNNEDSRLLASVESLSKYIHAHLPEINAVKSKDGESQVVFDQVRSLLAEVNDWQERWKEERTMQNKLKAAMNAAERDHNRKLEELEEKQEAELSKLKQENYILSAKISKLGKPAPQTVTPSAEDNPYTDQIQRLQAELAEQESLLAGFQRENRRLYDEQRAAVAQGKTTRDAMYAENQKLKTTISLLREEIERKTVALDSKGVITGEEAQQRIATGGATMQPSTAVMGAARIQELHGLYDTAKVDIKRLEQEAVTYRETIRDLREEIQQLKRKLADTKEQLGHLGDSQSQHAKDTEKHHRTEIDEMKRKLQWYAENQQLLDRDAQRLKEADSRVKALTQQLERRGDEATNKKAETKARLNEKSADAKKIQDLERQVHEMQRIVRRRHPDSLPVLMWAAATSATAGPQASSRPDEASVSFLETRVQKLEAELSGKDEQAESGLRALQQKYNTMKFKFEKRIEDLEELLKSTNQKLHETDHPHTHTVALQRELDSTRDRYKKRVLELETEVGNLKQQLDMQRNKESAVNKMAAKGTKEMESDLQLRVRALRLECTNQGKEKQLLQETIQRLRDEKQQLLIEATHRSGQNAGKAAKALGIKLKGKSSKLTPNASEPEETMQPLRAYTEPLSRDKDYEPDTFAGRHITDIVRENEELRIMFEQLQLQQRQQHVYAQKFRAETEASGRRSREDFDEQLTALKQTHRTEVERLLAEHAMQNSASKLAQLQSRVDTQQVQISHLKEQVACHELDAEKLAAVKAREATLETRVKSLLDELSEARACHTPEMRHFEALQMKLRDVTARQQHRQHELEQIIMQNSGAPPLTRMVTDLQQEAERWRHLAASKDRETETFRAELDSILDVLRELQRQGVVLPCRPVA